MKLPKTLYFLRAGWWAVHVIAPAVIFAGGVALGIFHATSPTEHAHGAAPASLTGNPLRDEMIDLHTAFDTLNTGVILSRTDGIEAAFHAVHARREATEAALTAGTVRPPRNGDNLAAFIAQDDAFHELIEATVEAARRDDLPALRLKSAEMLQACVACHAEFRDPPGVP